MKVMVKTRTPSEIKGAASPKTTFFAKTKKLGLLLLPLPVGPLKAIDLRITVAEALPGNPELDFEHSGQWNEALMCYEKALQFKRQAKVGTRFLVFFSG